MGIMAKMWGGVKRLFGIKSTYTIVVQQGADGFIPAAQFSGNSLDQLLEASTTSYACMSGNAEAAASLPLIVQRAGRGDEDRWVTERDHELNDIVADPLAGVAGMPRWGSEQLVETLSMQIDITGNAYMRKATASNGRPIALFPFNPSSVKAVTEADGPRLLYYEADGIRYAQDEIVHVMNASPGSLWVGQSPLRAALRAIEVDQTASIRQQANLANRIAPGMIISIKNSMTDGFGEVNEDQRKKVQADMQAAYQASTKDGTPLVVGGSIELVAPPSTNQQLDFFDTRRYGREEMFGVFRTPPPIAGVYDNATLQNFRTALTIWYVQAIFPRLGTIVGAFNKQLVEPHYGRDVRIWYDLTGSEIALLLLLGRLDAAKKIIDLGYSTNMAAAHVGLGLPRVPELDAPNRTLAVAGREPLQEGAEETGTAEPAASPEPAAADDAAA